MKRLTQNTFGNWFKIISEEDVSFVETRLDLISIPYGNFEKDILVGHAVHSLNAIKLSYESILLSSKDKNTRALLIDQYKSFLQTQSNSSQILDNAEKIIGSYLDTVIEPINESILKPINFLIQTVPQSKNDLIDWLNKANLTLLTVQDPEDTLLKYLSRYTLTITNRETGEVYSKNIDIEIISKYFSYYVREASLYSKASIANIEAWKIQLLERKKANPEILKAIIEKGANTHVFRIQLATFFVAIAFIFVGVFSNDIFDAINRKSRIDELTVLNNALAFKSEELKDQLKEVKDVNQKLESQVATLQKEHANLKQQNKSRAGK